MGFFYNPKIVTDRFLLCLDAASSRSYSGSGITWNDLSKEAFNGTLTNGPVFDSGNYGSFLFDGTNDFVNFSSNTKVQFLNTAQYTLEAWVRPNANPGDANFTGIFDRESNTVNGRDGYNMWFSGSIDTDTYFGTERFTSGTNTNVTITIPQSESVNTWNHIVATFDGSTLKLYRNGQFGDQILSNGSITNTAKVLNVGRRSSNHFNGRIACVRIYDYSLSSDQVIQNFGALRSRFGI